MIETKAVVEAADTALLSQWQDGRDAEAFRTLVSRHSGMVYATCCRMVGNAVTAEDLTQDCFLKLAESPKAIGEYLPAWLHTVAANRARDFLKAEKRRKKYHERYANERSATKEVSWDDISPIVDEAVEALPPKIRESIVRHFLEQESHSEIAESLQLSRRTVSYRIEKGIASIRHYLAQRSVPLGAGALSTFLGVGSVEATPKTLVASLNKIALAGPLGTAGPTSVTTASIVGGVILMKSKIIGVTIVLVVAVTIGVSQFRQTDPSPDVRPTLASEAISEAHVDSVQEPFVESALAESAEPVAETPIVETPSVEVVTIEEEAEPGKILDPALYATVSGYVVNASGEAIPGAEVTLIATGAAQGENEGEADLNTFFYKDAFKEEFNQTVFSKEHHFTTRTSNTGAFTIPGIAYEGQCIVVATADHHATVHTTIVLSEGESRSGIRMALRPGFTFVGRVVTQGGLPVTDAVVREVGGAVGNGYWAGGRGRIASTDENGHFRMGLSGEGVTMFHVVSPTAGQQTFNGIETDGTSMITLEIRPMASLNARLSWDDGTPAARLPVKLIGIYTIEIMHGENSASSTDTGGVIHAVVSEDGRYVFEELDPGQSYVMDIFDTEGEVLVKHAQVGDIKSGEEFQWHHVIDAPIYITGKVTGTKSGRALKGIKVFYMKKNMETLMYGNEYTDERGAYSFKLLAGSGTYAIFPKYGHQNFMYSGGDPYQQTVELRGGSHREVNLIFPEPVSLSFLVEDENGAPLSGVHVELPSGIGGSRSNFSRDLYTDENGRFTYDGFMPNREIRVIFSHEGFASTESLHYMGESEDVYPAERVILYGAAGLQGVALLEDGTPLSSQRVKTTVLFEGGKEIHLYTTTDLDGNFVITKGVPATDISLRVSFGETTWHSPKFQAFPGETIDLGIVQ